MSAKALGIPYMGSKRKLAVDILNFITNRHENISNFYDLFGGGGSISFTAIRDYKFNVHYNELNRHIYSLVDYLKSNKELDPKFYEWVTRADFFKQCNKSNQDADWYSGFVMSCWSFGNKQSGYIYGSDIEETKRLAHEFIVNGCLESMNKLGVDIPNLKNIKGVQKRRIIFCKEMVNQTKQRFDVQNLERLTLLEHLARLQNLQNLQNLQISNTSYENVIISGSAPIIYCDIPYKGTGEYKEGGFNHDLFYEWFINLDYPAYMSEYNSPFEVVCQYNHRSSLSATNNKKQVKEKLFWNGKGEIKSKQLNLF